MGYPSFTAGDILAASDMNAVGLWKNTTATVTSVGGTSATASNGTITIGSGNTSVTVSGAFSTTYDAYRIIISNLTVSASGQLRYNNDGATTNYSYGNPLVTIATGVFDSNRGAAQAYIDLGATTTSQGNAFSFDVINPFLAVATIFTGFGYQNSTTFGGVGTGIHTTATSYTGFRLVPSTGSLSGGTIRIYGYRN